MGSREHRWPNERPAPGRSSGRRRGQGARTLLLAALAALVLHVPLLAGLKNLLHLERRPQARTFTDVTFFTPKEIEEIKASQQRRLARLEQRKTQEKSKEKEKEKEKETPKDEPAEPKGQIVDLPRPREAVPPPEDARYLAQHNMRTARETKKMGKPGDPGSARPAAPGPTPPPGPKEQVRRKAERSVARLDAAKQPRAREAPPPEAPPSSLRPLENDGGLRLLDRHEQKLAIPEDLSLELPPAHRPLAPGSYEELLPPLLGTAAGGPPGNRGSDDYLPDLPEGDELSLNAREFRYWSFFQRMRENLKQHWRPGEKYRRRDPWGKVYGVRDRLTVLAVTLDRSGKVHDLQLVRGSGVDFLDDEALHAFHAAGSFPNPPPGLIETDGFIRFRFGFAVVHNASHFKLFRYDF